MFLQSCPISSVRKSFLTKKVKKKKIYNLLLCICFSFPIGVFFLFKKFAFLICTHTQKMLVSTLGFCFCFLFHDNCFVIINFTFMVYCNIYYKCILIFFYIKNLSLKYYDRDMIKLINEEHRSPWTKLLIRVFSSKCQTCCYVLGCKQNPHLWT